MTQVDLHQNPGSPRWTSAIRPLAAAGFVAVIVTATFADYLSSWLPSVGGFPAGAILRDGVAIVFVCLAGAILARDLPESWRASLASLSPRRRGTVAAAALLPFALLSAWVLLLVLPSPAVVAAVLAARNLLLYTAVGFAAYLLVTRRSLSLRVLLGTLTVIGFVAAGLGILDTATHGAIVTDLGYRRDYAGVEGSASRLVAGASAAFQGYVRASGGISNSLVFGYLMAALAVFATWMLERAVSRSGWRSWGALVYVALGIVTVVACIESLTRGAMIALVLGLLVLIVLRRSRPILIGAVVTMSMALLLTWAGSAPFSAAGPGQSGSGLLDIVGTRVTSSDASSQESTSMRIDQIRQGLASLAERPMGNGLGTEGSASVRAGVEAVADDNFVLIVALQAGIVGVGLYGLLFLMMLISAGRRPTPGRVLALAMMAIFAVSAVMSASPDAPVFATTIWVLILAVSAVPAPDHRVVTPGFTHP